MSVRREEVERIARLARLRLDEEEVERLTGDMSRILEHAERLRDVDEGPEVAGETEGSVPAAQEDVDDSQASGTRPPEADRPDTLHSPLEAFAPDLRDGLFAVPPPPGVVAAEAGADAARSGEDPGDGEAVRDDGADA